MSPRSYQDCLNTAIRLLARRDHSRMEMAGKLRQRGFEQNHIQSTIAECLRLNYLDDKKFARLYNTQLQRKGYGPRRIHQMLAAKGLAHQLISNTLYTDGQEAKERKNCRAVLLKKLKALSQHTDDRIPKERLYRFLSGRGFSPAVVQETLNDVLS